MEANAAIATLPRDAPFLTYEQQLSADLRWALEEAGRFFEGDSAVNRTLRNIAQRLDEIGVPYAVCGGLALFAHGYRRFTEDVDILVSSDGLKRIHEQLVGRGYLPPFERSKHLRDTETHVKIEFLTAGQYPGDGKPKPIAFPQPDVDAVAIDGIRYAGLRTLIELKLASGMTGAGRQRDLGDVQELIRILNLPLDFSRTLNPYVVRRFEDLWQSVNAGDRRFVITWPAKGHTAVLQSMDDLARALPSAADELRRMQADGVELDPTRGVNDGCAYLVTTDPGVAAKYGMEDERDLWGENGPSEPEQP